MRRMLLPVFAIMGACLTACSTAAPRPPIGLWKQPANGPEVIADLTRPPVALPIAAVVPTEPAARPIAGETRAAHQAIRPRTIVMSDQLAPRGIASLSPEARAELIEAARGADTTRLLCRGDRTHPSAAVRARLYRRGLAVKRFLVAQGVDPSRIRIYVRSAGAFVADNSTASGRAQNRRVEIQLS